MNQRTQPPFRQWREMTATDMIRHGVPEARAFGWRDNPCSRDETGEPSCPGWCFITDTDGAHGRIERCFDCCQHFPIDYFDDADAAGMAAAILGELLTKHLPPDQLPAVAFLTGLTLKAPVDDRPVKFRGTLEWSFRDVAPFLVRDEQTGVVWFVDLPTKKFFVPRVGDTYDFEANPDDQFAFFRETP